MFIERGIRKVADDIFVYWNFTNLQQVSFLEMINLSTFRRLFNFCLGKYLSKHLICLDIKTSLTITSHCPHKGIVYLILYNSLHTRILFLSCLQLSFTDVILIMWFCPSRTNSYCKTVWFYFFSQFYICICLLWDEIFLLVIYAGELTMKEFISAEELIYRFISVHSIFWCNFSPFFIFYCPIFLNLYIKAQLYFLFFVLFYPFSLKTNSIL